MTTFVTATAEHARAMELRDEDLAEIRASQPDRDPKDILVESVASSEGGAVAQLDRAGRVVCIFGLGVDDKYAYPWMLSSPLVERSKKVTMRVAPQMIEHWLEHAQGRPLVNWIHKHNESAKAFVQWLGFTIFPTPNGEFDFFILCANPSASLQQP